MDAPPATSIEWPDELVVTCEADRRPAEGLLVLATLRMLRKNNYHCVIGPSDRNGEIRVTPAELMIWAAETEEFFPMDYASFDWFAGIVEFEPMGIRQVESALKAHEIYRSSGPQPVAPMEDRLAAFGNMLVAFEEYHQATPGCTYEERLRNTRERLDRLAAKRLDVEVTSIPHASSHGPSGVALTIILHSVVPG